ncbi:MAG: site-2 protease family protein [Campylobacterota bacterium]|nr:site-2 protease family protein [Campylobacterota bacterium]
MYSNIISRPILSYSIFSIILGALFAMVISFFLPNQHFVSIQDSKEIEDINFNITNSLNIEKIYNKPRVIKIEKKVSREFILKDFITTGAIVSDDDSLVIVKNTKGGVFVYVDEVHKGYKLVEVQDTKAKFKKGENYYWSFLSPTDERNFKEKVVDTKTTKPTAKTVVQDTVSREMFESIKEKDGKYFVPKSILGNKRDIQKTFSAIRVMSYNKNGEISFKFNYVKPSSIYSKLGLRKYDYVTKINGEKIKSVTQPLKLFQNIENINQLSLTVKRGNQIKELKYEVY